MGTLERLTFEQAVIFHDGNGFASLRLQLRSSERLLILRIRWVGAEMVVEELLDLVTDERTYRSAPANGL
jgi:hypothetical protein